MAVKTVLIDAAGEAAGLDIVECWVEGAGNLKLASDGATVAVAAGQRLPSDAAYDYQTASTATLGVLAKV